MRHQFDLAEKVKFQVDKDLITVSIPTLPPNQKCDVVLSAKISKFF